jgi:hypothetical protein
LTIDERLQAIAMHLEVLTGVHHDFEKRVNEFMDANREFQKRMTEYAADVKDSIARLANIAAAHDERIDDHEKRIDRLET